jgi:hypothetical protein
MTQPPWDVRPASTAVERDWRRLRRAHPELTQKALLYWAHDPWAPNDLVIHPRADLALRQWGSGRNKKSYEQRGFIIGGTTAYFIVVDNTVIITAVIQFLIPDNYV